jgi:hypothetical protein
MRVELPSCVTMPPMLPQPSIALPRALVDVR